ncbi:hypothetical protein FHU33_2411 [Blastococcus colisei]|uniref:Uncharacterized protein n=1 Tax=Blastococcus colisei TaxID=1564162 RepID=A0A543PFY6_9ACTN|nr:hypothetical protein [Blastococcus colisei]TQN42991.1 hypothetical protein FHU33_2411 [Blastococcus colisei]
MRGAVRSGRRIAAVLAVTVLSGCATPAGSPAVPVDPGPVRPAAGGAALVAEAHAPEQPVVLDRFPDGLLLQELRHNEAVAHPGYEPARATLYGDPTLADTLDGPVLLVGTSSGSAFLGGPPCCLPGERQVDLGGRDGLLVHDADRTWVNVDPGSFSDHVQFVVARGVSDDDLIAAAATADFSTATAALAADAVPAGLAPLIAGSPADGPFTGSVGEEFVLAGESGWVIVSAVRADPRLAALWGFWTDDPVGTVVRGQPGSLGDMHGIYYGDDARGYVWAENGLVLSVIGLGDGDQFLEQVVQDLRFGTVADLEAMRHGAIDRLATPEGIGCQAGTPIVTGGDGDLRWAIGVEPGPAGGDQWVSCLQLFTLDGVPPNGSGPIDLPPVGQIAVTSVGSGEGVATFPKDVLIGGVAPPETARVVIGDADGRTVDAVLAEPGPRPGEVLFGTFIQDVPVVMNGPRLVVTAYDATGAVLDTAP